MLRRCLHSPCSAVTHLLNGARDADANRCFFLRGIYLLKITKTWTSTSLLLAPLAEAQEVSRLEIVRGANGSEARTSIYITTPLDIVNLDFNNPINANQIRLAIAKDDSGGDLLAAHEALVAEWVAQGYATESPVSFGGIADHILKSHQYRQIQCCEFDFSAGK